MKLSDVMHRDPQVIRGDTTLREAAQRMRDADIGALPVCEGDRIEGVLTDRDVVVRSIAQGDDPEKARAADVMTREIAWCFDDDSIDEASRKMSERQVQRLLVLNHDKKLVGIVSIGDLARQRGNAPAVTHTIEEIKKPTKPSAAGADASQTGR